MDFGEEVGVGMRTMGSSGLGGRSLDFEEDEPELVLVSDVAELAV